MFRKRWLLAVGAVAVGAAFGLLQPMTRSSVASADGPDPNSVYVQSISYGGTGCPQGTVGQSISNDRTVFTLIFDSFVASSGPGVPVTEGRKNCQLNVNVHVPANVTADLFTVDYRGYMQLPAGVTGTQSATYFVGGSDPQADDGSSFPGPVAKDYLTHDNFVANFGCGSERVVPININAQVRLAGAPNAQAQITTDSIDGKFSAASQPCSPSKDDCKKGGWQNFVAAPGPFKNQGDCVSYFSSGGKNTGNGN